MSERLYTHATLFSNEHYAKINYKVSFVKGCNEQMTEHANNNNSNGRGNKRNDQTMVGFGHISWI